MVVVAAAKQSRELEGLDSVRAQSPWMKMQTVVAVVVPLLPMTMPWMAAAVVVEPLLRTLPVAVAVAADVLESSTWSARPSCSCAATNRVWC